MTIDVIIPLYKPGKEVAELLERLSRQTMPVHKIILMNTEKQYYDALVESVDIEGKYPNVEVHHLPKSEFDHGGTRRLGVTYSEADVFVCMTQDAMPSDIYLIEKLTGHLEGKVAAAYARQLPSETSSELEKISRVFNYPAVDRIKSAEDLQTLGIKTYFCSNVCAAYRRECYEQVGGFVKRTIFNEDMLMASALIGAGYSISYESEAKVIHSHNYGNMQQFHRNFDMGVSQAEHPEVFEGVPSESEGKKLVKATWQELRKAGKTYLFPGFCVQCAFKYAGYKAGKSYKKLPMKWVLSFSDNKSYWK